MLHDDAIEVHPPHLAEITRPQALGAETSRREAIESCHEPPTRSTPGRQNYDSTVARDVLACSVRGCGQPLGRTPRAYVCPRGHSHDIARSGYVSLLQPQDRRSLKAGDASAALDARLRLLAAGVGRALVATIVAIASQLRLDADAAVVDLGAGTGDLLGEMARRRPITAVGIDLSAAAMAVAAKRFPSVTWVVANADRRLPILDRSIALVLSVNARRNPAECARVLDRSGRLLVAVPAADDLIELRELVQGRGVERDRAKTLLEEHDAHFSLIEQSTVRERRLLSRYQLLDVLRGTYRGARTSAASRVDTLTSLDVSFASELRLFAAK
jgi:23S rRNA (guanine745-N1)-methyltransferase